MKISEYALKARYAPALVTIVLPIMVFNHFFISAEFAEFVGKVIGAKLVSNLTISTICLYFFSEFGRFLGKHVFENCYYKHESQMPTTNFLMQSDSTYSSEYKEQFGERVYKEFGFKLPSVEDQLSDEAAARTRIVEVMGLIRKKLGNNKFLLQHNIEYGAMRNAIGGSIFGVCFCLVNIGFFWFVYNNKLAVYISAVLFVPYIFLILLSKVIINFYGLNYTKVLFREYMGNA